MKGPKIVVDHSNDDPDGRMRLDQLLVARGLSETRSKARAAIKAGGVTVGGVVAEKSAARIPVDAVLELRPAHPWASRGGVKLDHALKVFGVSARDRICLDVGASTGGFTDVLLGRGAAHVYAVDVGRGQMTDRLSRDARVTSMEGVDARTLSRTLVPRPVDLIVCDASFIGLEKVSPAALGLGAANCDLVALFKPQFQVGPSHVGKGGVVTDVVAADDAAAACETWLSEQGWRACGWTQSPILGGDGNQERLVHARRDTAFEA